MSRLDGGGAAPGATAANGGAKFLFERANRLGERGLRNEDAARGLADAAARRDGVRILERMEVISRRLSLR